MRGLEIDFIFARHRGADLKCGVRAGRETEEPPFETTDDLFQCLPARRAVVARVRTVLAQYEVRCWVWRYLQRRSGASVPSC